MHYVEHFGLALASILNRIDINVHCSAQSQSSYTTPYRIAATRKIKYRDWDDQKLWPPLLLATVPLPHPVPRSGPSLPQARERQWNLPDMPQRPLRCPTCPAPLKMLHRLVRPMSTNRPLELQDPLLAESRYFNRHPLLNARQHQVS